MFVLAQSASGDERLPPAPPAPLVAVKHETYQGRDVLWWAARAVRARREANARAVVIRRLRAKLKARSLQAVDPRTYAGPCLAAIIDHEGSGWDPTRSNSQGSGAYGLPQALPGSKMASAGPDWRTNPLTQIRWMRGYVVARYGSCEAALAHWNAVGSY